MEINEIALLEILRDMAAVLKQCVQDVDRLLWRVAPVRDLRLRLDSIILAQSSYSYKAHARYRYSRQHRGSWSQCRARAHVLTGNDRTCRNHLDTSAQVRRPRQNTSGLIPIRIESTPNALPPWRRVPACLGALAIL